MIANRKEARQAVYTLIADQIPAAQTVLDHQPINYTAGSPLVYLTSSGSQRPPMTGQGTRNNYFITAHIVVVFSDQSATPPFTNELAEDSLDDIENQLANAIQGARRREHFWQDLRYIDRTLAEDVIVVGGVTYFHEIIPLVMEVF